MAIAHFEAALRHLPPSYPLAQYHLAQAHRRKGQTEQARAAYERFLQIWKGADAVLPEMVDVRKELAALGHATGS